MPQFECCDVFKLRAIPPDRGFTLVELVVVVALISIMVSFTLPRFVNMLSDEKRTTSQWILLEVPELKERAVSEDQVYTLHADISNGRLWFSGSNMTDEELNTAMNQGITLTDSFYIVDVIYGNNDGYSSGDAPIYFYPKGYSSKAILHMEESDGDRRSFIFEPFLTQVEIVDGYADFEN